MISLDTNILARFLLSDDPVQFKLARDLLARPNDYTTPPTVLLELVWVLESYDCTRAEILQALRMLLRHGIRKDGVTERHCAASADVGTLNHLRIPKERSWPGSLPNTF